MTDIFENKNTTNFPSLLQEYIKNIKEDDVLFKYQNIVYNYLKEPQNRGLIVIHDTGTGKTITSISLGEYFRKNGRDVFIISSKSLKGNYIKEIKNYNKKLNKDIKETELDNIVNEYKFVTMNSSNMIKQFSNQDSEIDKILLNVNKFKLDNKVVIVDEAHNLFNSIVNGSKLANEFYDIVMKSKNIKLIFLTGSPIVNTPFEIVAAINMCKGFPILPEYYEDFKDYFIDEQNNEIKNKDVFQRRILGSISYYGSLYFKKYHDFVYQLHNSTKNNKDFPTKLPIKLIRVPMSSLQNVYYLRVRDEEKRETGLKMGRGIKFDKNSISGSYRMKSRQASNGLPLINDLEKNPLNKDNIKTYSTKMYEIYENILKHPKQLGLIYSTFLGGGIKYFSNILNLKGYSEFNIEDYNNSLLQKEDKNKSSTYNFYKTYAFYTGEIELDIKNQLLSIFNNENNKDGKYLSLIMISSAGSEGLDLKGIRHIHIIEPYWNYARIHQVISRGIRYKSHDYLSEKDRNVQIYMYLSIYNTEYEKKYKKDHPDIPLEKTTDMTIFLKSVSNQKLIDKTNLILFETSIECEFFNTNLNFDCFSCIPNNKELYQPDIKTDITLPSTCQKPITVEEILVDDIKYYINPITNDVYIYDIQTEGYIPVSSSIKDKIIDFYTKNQKKII